MRPLIAVCPLANDKRQLQLMQPGYLKGIELAGGAPVGLPLTDDVQVLEAILERCAGVLIPGGHDVEPARYGQELLLECGELSLGRDRLEDWVIGWALERDMPILGICRGVQMLNVHLGGTLYQDLPTQRPESLNHSQQPPYEELAGSIRFICLATSQRRAPRAAQTTSFLASPTIRTRSPSLAPARSRMAAFSSSVRNLA